MRHLRNILTVLILFAGSLTGAVVEREGCTVPEGLKLRNNVHQCSDCSFRARSPFDSRNDAQRCGEEAVVIRGPRDTSEFTAIFGPVPDPRTSNLRGMKLRVARQRYNERRTNWGGVFTPGDANAPFYVTDDGETLSASAAGTFGQTALKIPGLDSTGLELYNKATKAKVDNIYSTWGLGVPVLWIEYNSYIQDRKNGGYKRGTAIKVALPGAPLPLFFDSWAFATYTVPHLQVSQAHIKLMKNCHFPEKVHPFVPPTVRGRAKRACEAAGR